MAVLSGSPRLTRSAAVPPAGVVAAVSAAALCAASILSPSDATHGPVICPFRLATGLPCPGCGMTRAWVFLAHAQVGDAVAANPFVLVTMPTAVLLVLACLLALARRRPLPDLTPIARSRLTTVVVACWIGFAVVRAVAVLTGHATV